MAPLAPFVRIRTGLLDPKHIEHLGGSPLLLYLYLHGRVRMKGEGAGTTFPTSPYTHQEASEDLHVPIGTIRRWFGVLREHGYITAKQLQHGLIVTITNFEPEPNKTPQTEPTSIPEYAEMSTLEDVRVSTSEQSAESEGAQKWAAGCSDLSGRVLTNEHPIYKEDSRDTEDSREETRLRALTPHQVIVNAYLEGLGRDPFKASDFSRYTKVGAELAAEGYTPQDVRNCTKYLRTDPWRREKGRMPSIGDVRDALPTWIEDGRPATVQQVERRRGGGNERGRRDGLSHLADKARAEEAQEFLYGPSTPTQRLIEEPHAGRGDYDESSGRAALAFTVPPGLGRADRQLSQPSRIV